MSNNNHSAGGLIDPIQLNQITQAITGLNANQLTWMSGYMAGMAALQDPALAAPQQISAVAAAEPVGNLTIIYG
ncbi:sulfite reductase [NADPH] flavoprotein alpha-component, partial [Glaciecola sp.]|nr:sulfite reductase [NADPH] flavoprotein alpha-component [Glaciecola sp.]